MKHILAILLLLITSTQIKASTLEEINALYKEGNYEQAISGYEAIIQSGVENEMLYYNLGNAAYKLNKIGLSIWAYEKALKIKPNDKDIKHNLQLVNLKIKDNIVATPKFFIIQWMSSISHSLTSNNWAWISLFLGVSAILSLLFYLFSKRLLFRKAGFFKFIAFTLLAVITLVFAIATSRKSKEAIIYSYSTTAKSEPAQASTDLFIMHEGLKVKILGEEESWIQIQLPNEMKGWIKVSDIKPL